MWWNENVIRMSWTTMALVKTSKNFSVFTRIHSCITSIIKNKNLKRILKILDWNGDVSQVAISFHPWGFHCLQEPLGHSIYQVRLVFYLTLSASLIAQWALNNYQLNWIAPGNVTNKNNEHMVTNKLYDLERLNHALILNEANYYWVLTTCSIVTKGIHRILEESKTNI